jgi:hypothetical protein
MPTVGTDSDPCAARRRFVMRAALLVGVVAVIATGAAGVGAGAASASPHLSPNRAGQLQPRILPTGHARAGFFVTDDPADPGQPCAPTDPCPPQPNPVFNPPAAGAPLPNDPYNPYNDPTNPMSPMWIAQNTGHAIQSR